VFFRFRRPLNNVSYLLKTSRNLAQNKFKWATKLVEHEMKVIANLTYVGHEMQKVEGCYIYFLYVVIHGCKVHFRNIKKIFLMCFIIHEK